MKHNKRLTPFAQSLRKNMTPEEKRLWYHYLKNHPLPFRRQVTCGVYILDFYCAKAKLAIEIDGSHHYEPEGMDYDRNRTSYLQSIGISVLRFPNNAIWKILSGVCKQIDYELEQRGFVRE